MINPKAKTIITVKDLIRTYPGKIPLQVLKGINFEIKEGEFTAIMGRSGGGKSTLLHQLSMLDRPDEGSVIIDGVDITQLDDDEQTMFRLNNLGYVFQDYALIPTFTALETVCLPLVLRHQDWREAKKTALRILELVGLAERADHLPSEMSGGEQQRISIARALVNNPTILFADEPCANLDSESSAIILDLFQKCNREMNQTIVMVTHEPEDKKFVDRVIFLKDGLVESSIYQKARDVMTRGKKIDE